MSVRVLAMIGVVMFSGLVRTANGQEAGGPNEQMLRTALVIEGIGGGGRTLIQTDAVDALRVKGEWKSPAAGDEVVVGDSNRRWDGRAAGEDGWVRVRGGGYALWTVDSPAQQVMILEASGHSMAIVNGEPRGGDPYEYGYAKLPVMLNTGANEVLLKSGRGRVKAKLTTPPSPVFLNAADLTMPDLLVGQDGMFGAIIVVNATTEVLTGAALTAIIDDDQVSTPVPAIPALSARKVRIDLPATTRTAAGEADCTVMLHAGGATVGEPAEFKLKVRLATDKHKRTFISDIDGSVQYYAVVPPPRGTDLGTPKAVLLSLHGASVEATNQANCYKQRDWCYVVCATNRRPFGFDWEDWGRMDGLEVLAHARSIFSLDERRTYLTGHSMGGHGTWNIGVQFPGTFAAIGPSAGWISFWSYTGGANRENVSPIEAILLRASCTSDTLAMKQNLAQQGVYILHGDADDNVPVDQARTMRKELAEFHPDFAYYEEPGAGHWWGDQCVDWDPMIEFFKRHTQPEPAKITTIDFTTVNPDVSGTCHWATITEQQTPFEASRVTLKFDGEKRQITGSTTNVAALELDAEQLWTWNAEKLVLDGQEIELPQEAVMNFAHPRVVLERVGEQWASKGLHSARESRPRLFKTAFTRRMMLVYGTQGSEGENAWALAKAKYDAETFWYRGNGSIDVVADTEFQRDTSGESQRNVILYGNADTNAAWAEVLGDDAPIQVRNGSITVGEKTVDGENLSCMFLARLRDDPKAMVGVVSGTGLPGMKLTDRQPYFVSGVGIPDWVVLSTDLLTQGASGVIGAGFFDRDWKVGDDSAWRE